MSESAKTRALKLIPYGLFVAGTTEAGDIDAFAAAWLTQCSFDPPQVALAIKVGTRSHEMVRRSGLFSVTVLASGQGEIAAKFFQHVEPAEGKFADVAYTIAPNGCPVLEAGLAWFECRVVGVVERGDHHVFVGEVISAGVQREGEPLTLRETGRTYGG